MTLQRVLLFLGLFLLSGCAFEEGDDDGEGAEPTEEAESAITAGPQWKMVTLVLRDIDTSYITANGFTQRAQGRMSAAVADKAKTAARALPAKFEQWNGGRAPASMTIIDVEEPIRRVTKVSEKYGHWVAPEDIAGILDKYAPTGRYDSIFVMWDPDATSPDIPTCCAWGTGPSGKTNGATYAVIEPFAMNPEAMVHEWLHGAAGFYQSKGLDVPDPHENRDFGFGPASDGTWHHWYQPLLRGSLLRGGKVVGYTSNVWRSGTPRRWIGGSYPAPPRPALAQPEMRSANANGDKLYFQWTPVKKTTHYFQWVAIKRADGTIARNVSRYAKPHFDGNNVDWDEFSKAEICAAARQAGVPLSSLRLTVEIWPDSKKELATRMNVTGSFDCR